MDFPVSRELKIQDSVRGAIQRAVEQEPFAQTMKMELVELEAGFSAVEMTYETGSMNNIYGRTHGGAIYSLIDEAFETVSQSDGTVGVALNVSVTYVTCPEPGARLRAEAREISRTRKTSGYEIKVTDREGRVIATCQALAYRTGKPVPLIR